MTRLTLDLEWRTTLLTLLLFPTLIVLGFWQLDRADEKTHIAAQDAERAVAQPIPLVQLEATRDADLAYRRVVVSGHFVPDVVILLDNQIRDGRYGHDVFGVFFDRPSGQYALLNRGWVPGDPSRRSVPAIDVPAAELTLAATVYVSPGTPYLLAEDQFGELSWPVLVQTASSPALYEMLGDAVAGELFPKELRLAADAPEGFRRDWPVVNVSPEKHRGYALQWFTMSAALLLFFMFRSSNILSLVRGRPSPETVNSKEQ